MVSTVTALAGELGTDWARAMLASVRQAARTVLTFAVLVGVFMGDVYLVILKVGA